MATIQTDPKGLEGSVPPQSSLPPQSNGNGASLDAHVELQELVRVLSAIRDGDFRVRLPNHWTGLLGKVADTVNDVVSTNEVMASQLQRTGQAVGKEGRTRQRVRFSRSVGAWSDMETSINTLIDDLVWP